MRNCAVAAQTVSFFEKAKIICPFGARHGLQNRASR